MGEIASTAESLGAHSVAISVTKGSNIAQTANQLLELRKLMDQKVHLLVGGGSAHLLNLDQLPDGMFVILKGLPGLREALLKGAPSTV